MSDETLDILIYRPDHPEPEARTIPMPRGYDAMNRAFLPILGADCEYIEHVTVLYEGRRADLFVDEYSALDRVTRPRLPENAAATVIYHTASRVNGVDVTDAPRIHGVAILTKTRIWY